jgi:hypothetical protein
MLWYFLICLIGYCIGVTNFSYFFQEIASMLIAFDRHADWLSKEVKIRFVEAASKPKKSLVFLKYVSQCGNSGCLLPIVCHTGNSPNTSTNLHCIGATSDICPDVCFNKMAKIGSSQPASGSCEFCIQMYRSPNGCHKTK